MDSKNIENENNKKLWFLHMPKTGGIFLRHYFEEYYNDCIGMSKPRNHDGVNQIKNFNNYYKFGFVRNPWDYRVSFYFYTSDTKRDGEKFIEMHPTFEHFIKATHNKQYRTKPYFENIYYESVRYKNIFYIDDKLSMDYVGKYETLYEDIIKIFEINGIEMKYSIEKYYEENKKDWEITNYSKHEHYSKYYTNELIDIVYEQEKLIIDTYDYKFEKE